jgi:hypothetical protein
MVRTSGLNLISTFSLFISCFFILPHAFACDGGLGWTAGFWLKETQDGFPDSPEYFYVQVNCAKDFTGYQKKPKCVWKEVQMDGCLVDGGYFIGSYPRINVYTEENESSTNGRLKVKRVEENKWIFTMSDHDYEATFHIDLDCEKIRQNPWSRPVAVSGAYSKRLLNNQLTSVVSKMPDIDEKVTNSRCRPVEQPIQLTFGQAFGQLWKSLFR